MEGHADKIHLEAYGTLDLCARLAESVGALQVENPQQDGQWGGNINQGVDETLSAIAAKLKWNLVAPRAGGGMFGLPALGGVLSSRDLIAIYTANRIFEILGHDCSKSIAEIGGGMGLLGFHLYSRGCRSIRVFDLPQVSAIQAYFLLKSLPGARIRLWGETISDPEIEVLPFWLFGEGYDLVVNSDSFPEIEKSIVLGYLRQIERSKMFLSINQEAKASMWNPEFGSQHVVADIVTESGAQLTRRYRFPFWMRPGYVEELYDSTVGKG